MSSLCALDESVIGGLSLLLMAGQHTAATTTASLFPVLTSGDDMKRDNILLATATLGSRGMQQPQPCQVINIIAVASVILSSLL